MDHSSWNSLDRRAINMAKALIADAVENAGSGHPGSAISLTPLVYILYQRFLTHDPSDPQWEGRDKFILSGGHASLAQYTQLYLSGYLTLNDIKGYRTANSRTPGHPEYGMTPGIEMTTGPLGQGLATAVGFAYAQRFQQDLFDPHNTSNTSPFNHKIWVICGEGDIEEGVSAEASALAGSQELGNLFVLFDANHVQIEGDTDLVLSENVLQRYQAYGWYTDEIDLLHKNEDGSYSEDLDAVTNALLTAEKVTDKPHFIKVNSLIAWPTPVKTNSASAHGAPLGDDAIRGLKDILGIDPNRTFFVDEEALAYARQVADRGHAAHREWDTLFNTWKEQNPQEYALYERLHHHQLPENFSQTLDALKETFTPGHQIPTRQVSGKVINALASIMPELWGGSADLGGSNQTIIQEGSSFIADQRTTEMWPAASKHGQNLHFGVREFAMGCITNGIILNSDTRVFNSTFLQFSDYERAAVRLAALMDIPNLFIWTHDSVALGEDGPTHQPIEHLTSLRVIPRLEVIRPADAYETIEAYRYIFEKDNTHPSSLILSRQKLPNLSETKDAAREGIRHGAYIIHDNPHNDAIIMASGSEVYLALQAATQLEEEGIHVRVLSVPSIDIFNEQSAEYKEALLPSSITARVSVEAGSALSWYQYIGTTGIPIAIDQFGLQGSGTDNLQQLGITVDHIVDSIHTLLN